MAPSALSNPGGDVQAQVGIQDAVLELQKFLGLPQTGKLDEKTVAMMQKPRCGNPDRKIAGSRSKRYAVMGSGWTKLKITYS